MVHMCPPPPCVYCHSCAELSSCVGVGEGVGHIFAHRWCVPRVLHITVGLLKSTGEISCIILTDSLNYPSKVPADIALTMWNKRLFNSSGMFCNKRLEVCDASFSAFDGHKFEGFGDWGGITDLIFGSRYLQWRNAANIAVQLMNVFCAWTKGDRHKTRAQGLFLDVHNNICTSSERIVSPQKFLAGIVRHQNECVSIKICTKYKRSKQWMTYLAWVPLFSEPSWMAVVVATWAQSLAGGVR